MLTYFLQVNLCWLLFYGLYYALLSRETFFTLNRIYLIVSLLAGLVIPLSISKVEIVTQSHIVEIVQPIVISIAVFQQNIETNMVETQAETWSLWIVLLGIYGLGVAFFLVKFSIGLYKIFQLYKEGEIQQKEGFKLVKTVTNKTPFSFFNCIFINDEITENVDFQQIIAHEKAHVHQKHSFDIVGLEILRGVFWLSPLVHLYAQSLRNVHEYLADAAVLSQKDSFGANTEKKQYGRLLISQTAAASGLVLVNHFNFSQLKKRIIMMTRNRSQRWMLLKYMLVAPIFLLLVSFFIAPNNTLMHKTADFSDNVTATIDKMGETIQLKKQDLSANVAVSNKTELLILQEDSLRKPYSLSNPLARLGGKSGGLISKETMNNQTYLHLIQPPSQRPVVCAIQSFQLIRVPFGLKSNQESKNTGQKFNAETLALIQQAQDGDSYQFVNIKGRCPGDVAARDLGNLSFIIGENKEDALRNELGVAYIMDVERAKTNMNSDCIWKEGDTGQMPVFPGGEAEIEKFINSHLRYPEESKKAGRECMFIVNYVISEEGYVTDVKSWKFKWANPHISTTNQKFEKMEPEDQPMADEAVRVIRSMPRWKPGTTNGVISCHRKSFIFKFKLPK